ncbi:MAG: LysR family transcriptional regulator, partial [Clostridiales bacterium]|nr:LysR family transcriptional regulator [Clostridiales bacterium]
LQQLKYVAIVEKYGSFSKAAQKLYVSQPSISKLVHSLEEELGITIFDRSSTGITITPEGRELLKLGNKLMRDAEYINEYFYKETNNKKASFFVSSQHYNFVVAAFAEFVKKIDSNHYMVGLSQTKTASIIDDVRKQYSNIGIIFLSALNRNHMLKVLDDNNLEFHKLTETVPHIFCSNRHPLAAKSSVSTDDLLDYPCIMYEQTLDSPGFYQEEMILPNFYPTKVIYLSDLYISEAILTDCGAYDIGTGIITKRLSKTIACIPIEVDDTVDIGWIGIKDKKPDALENEFLKYLKKQISNCSTVR